MKILVADDSRVMRQIVIRTLRQAGFSGHDIVEAEDGVDALERAEASSPIALVIVDINMPRMNGLEFLAAFREDRRYKGVPAVILTTEAQPALVARAKSLGAQGWIIKPFDPAQLIATVHRVLLR